MKKDRNKGGGNRPDRRESTEHPEEAYVYLVKNPSSNEISVCAWDSALYPGTQVIAPTRYGLDLGMVLGSATEIGHSYEPGCVRCQGVCLRAEEPVSQSPDSEGPGEQEAFGELTEDGSVVIEQDGGTLVERLSVEELVEVSSCIEDDSGEAGDVAMSSMAESTSTVTVTMESVGITWTKEPDEDPCAGCGDCYKRNLPKMVEVDGDVDWIDRLATPEDLRRYQENLEKEGEALKLCREKVSRHGLDMKLVTAHYLLGEPKLLFFFTADVRVDFRELVKDLVSIFRIRIELRQIGVRDESRVLGGLAVCGRDFCCHSVTDKLNPVSIKMAKEQNLSLNSMKISGPCGRLLCCLSYEYDFYIEEKQKYPPEGSRLKIDHDLMKITEVNILSRKISLAGPDGRFLTIPCSAVYFNEEMNRWEITKAYLDEFFSN